MKYFIEELWKVSQIVLYGVFTMIAMIVLFAVILSTTPLPAGFETGFAVIALTLATIVIGICSGYTYFNISTGVWISELTAGILLIASHFISANSALRWENAIVFIVAGLGSVMGGIIARTFRKVFQKIRAVVFNRKII